MKVRSHELIHQIEFHRSAGMSAGTSSAPSRLLFVAPRRVLCVLGFAGCCIAAAQVITIDKQGRATTDGHAATVDRRFAQIEPTHVTLSKTELDPKTRQECDPRHAVGAGLCHAAVSPRGTKD